MTGVQTCALPIYKRLDKEWTRLSQQEIYCRLAIKVPNFTREAAHSSELGILQRCIKSGGRGVSIRKLFDQIPNLLPRLYMVCHMFMKWNPWILFSGQLYALGMTEEEWLLLILCMILLIVIAVLHEKGIRIRESFAKQPLIFRWLILFAGIFVILIAGIYGPGYDSTQFIYGGF